MSKIEAILNYQKTDAKLRKLEVEVENSADYKRAAQARDAFNDAKKRAETSEQNAREILQRFETITSAYAESQKKLEEIESSSVAGIDEANAEKLRAQTAKVIGHLQRLEKEIGTLNGYIGDVIKKNDDAHKQGSKLRTVFNESKAKYEALKQSKEPEMAKYRAELEEIAKNTDKKHLDMYLALRKDKVLPAFVTLSAGLCGGCVMDLSMNALSKLKTDGMIECEHCRRIIYLG